ncbi:hypothetical protein ACLKA7_015435 [Drosophila subpalustris]
MHKELAKRGACSRTVFLAYFKNALMASQPTTFEGKGKPAAGWVPGSRKLQFRGHNYKWQLKLELQEIIAPEGEINELQLARVATATTVATEAA